MSYASSSYLDVESESFLSAFENQGDFMESYAEQVPQKSSARKRRVVTDEEVNKAALRILEICASWKKKG